MKEKCRETLERAYVFLDGEALSVSERREIEVHLEECRPCLERYGLEKELTAIVARLKGSECCPEGLRVRITQMLEHE
jgi:mycothiol system anti-sigma-R factor